MPRYIGVPNQFFCESNFAFKNFETLIKNKAPFFTGTFQFKDKETPIIDNLFFDIDSYFSLRIPYRNVKMLNDWCHKHDLPTIICFSGCKGFHLYLMFKPIIPTSQISKDTVQTLMYSVQMRIAEETKIEAYDEPTFARLKFLCRYPTSLYWRRDDDTGKMETSGYYCRYLTDEEFESGLKRISHLVKEPGIVPKAPKPIHTLQEIADMFSNFKIRHRQENNIAVNLQRNGMEVPTLAALGLPCLQELSKHSHPTHFERIELVSFLKFLGYADMSIGAFIRNCNWTRYSYSITSYQIGTIKARMVKCSFLKQSYGNVCDKCTYRRK